MFALNHVTTEDEYSPGNTLECPGTREVNITVEGAAVLVQFAFRTQGYTSAAPVWSPPEGIRFAPGFHSRGRNVEQIRVKSFTKGEPGHVTIEAVS